MFHKIVLPLLVLAFPFGATANSILNGKQELDQKVNETISALIKEQAIPGMAVGVIHKGKPHYYTYGLADVKRHKPVTSKTIFELGSVSKTFTGVLAADSIARNEIKLTDPVKKHWPELTGPQWNNINVLHLATYSAGGLPLQIPDGINDKSALLEYYQQWQPSWAPGTKRVYSNASLGLFGVLTANAAQMDFQQAMQTRIIEPLKLSNTWFNIPKLHEKNYAWGYVNNQPRHVSPGMLDDESYGLKSSIEDMTQWMHINMDSNTVKSSTLQKGIGLSQLGYYYSENKIYQGLGWEMYDYPVNEELVIRNSSNDVALLAKEIQEVKPEHMDGRQLFIHKTGATSGFGAYVAFIPSEKIGIVMLANKNFPNAERVKAAFAILNALH